MEKKNGSGEKKICLKAFQIDDDKKNCKKIQL